MMYSIECPAEINGNAETVDLYSYGDTMMDSFKNPLSAEICQRYMEIPNMCWQYIVNTPP